MQKHIKDYTNEWAYIVIRDAKMVGQANRLLAQKKLNPDYLTVDAKEYTLHNLLGAHHPYHHDQEKFCDEVNERLAKLARSIEADADANWRELNKK